VVIGFGNPIASVLSTIGGTSLIVTSIMISPHKIQKNRIDYSQWMIAYFNWINSHYRVSSMILDQSQNAYLTADSNNLTKDSPKPQIDQIWKNMKPVYTYLDQLSLNTIRYMESLCEFPLSENENENNPKISEEEDLQNSNLTNIKNKEDGEK